jgi:hypothetical protein
VAEILVDHGSIKDALYHLERGSESFAKVRQVSTGLALMDGIWARWHVRQAEFDKAEKTLRTAIRRGREHVAPRVDLVLLADLVRLKMRLRQPLGAVTIVGRAGWLYIRAEASGSPRKLLRQARVAIQIAKRILVSRALSAQDNKRDTSIACPCGANHA